LLNPARLILDKYVGFFENMDNRSFVENFVRMEKWIFDSPDVPGATFRQFIEDCYKKNKLINSEMELDGKRVDLKNLSMPLLNIYGKFDHLVPPQACELLTDRVGSEDTEDLVLDTGHIGIYVSSKCQKLFAPKINEWLKEREGTPKKFAAGRKTRRSAAGKTASGAAKKSAKAKTASTGTKTGNGPAKKTASRRKSSTGQSKTASTADKTRK
jgi:polyhydroxyalkanoate synthase subunit PhaC